MMTVPSDKLLAATLRAIGDGVISCDSTGRVLLMNPVAEELTGWREAEAVGMPLKQVFRIVNELTRQPVEDPVDKVCRLGTVVSMATHTLLLRRDGSELAIDDSAAPVQDEQGGLQSVVLVFRDVTQRRYAEWNLQMLARSGEALAHAGDAATAIERIGELTAGHFADLVLLDVGAPDGTYRRYVSRAGMPRFSFATEEVDSLRAQVACVEHPAGAALAADGAVLLPVAGVQGCEMLAFTPEQLDFFRNRLRPRSLLMLPMQVDGESVGVLTFLRVAKAAPFKDPDRMVAQELATRVGLAVRRAEERRALAEREALLSAIVESVPVGLLVADAEGRILFGNGELDRVVRHKLMISHTLPEYVGRYACHPDGQPLRSEEYPMVRALLRGEVIRGEEYLYGPDPAARHWVSISATPVRSAEGKLLGAVVAAADVDERVQAQARRAASEALLSRSTERFEQLIERASVGIAIGDMDGGFSYLNPALLKTLGFSQEEVEEGKVRWSHLTSARQTQLDEDAVRELQETGSAQPYETALQTKAGHLVPLLLGATVIPSLSEAEQSQPEVATFFTDLTRQKLAEAALLQTEKLAAVGKLASTISHEINNPLEAVTNLLFIVRQDPTLSQSSLDYLEAADRELARVSQVTAQTLRFHRQSTGATTVGPDALLEEVLLLYAARLANSAVEVRREYGPGVLVTCFEGDIRQVLNHLIGNALDAMRTGGRMTVRTRQSTRWSTGEEGVRITVADSGTGMSPEVLRQVFDAFFTTKGINGTGLGLWISCRIVHKHKGYVRAYTSTEARHHGAVFSVWLPAKLANTAREPWHVQEDTVMGMARS